MERTVLKNGITTIVQKKRGNSVAIEISVAVGSNDEPRELAGITHFLEHMVFEGTETRTAQELSAAIESVGGELNAMTTNERTAYYAKVPKKHFKIALDILTDILLNPTFDAKAFDKEKKVVLDEIRMSKDQPTQYQWILFESVIFKKNLARYPVYGTTASVNKITREQMRKYHRTHYIPNNVTVCISGDVRNANSEVEKRLSGMEQGIRKQRKPVREPPHKKVEVKRVKRAIEQSYVIIGHRTVDRNHKDSYALDIVAAILCKGLSGKIVEEIRIKRGLAYSIGTFHESEGTYGFMSTQFNTAPKNVALCRKLVLEELKRLVHASQNDVDAAKEYLEGKKLLEDEDVMKVADNLAFWETVGTIDDADAYIKRIRAVSLAEIKKVTRKYLLLPHTMAVIEPPG